MLRTEEIPPQITFYSQKKPKLCIKASLHPKRKLTVMVGSDQCGTQTETKLQQVFSGCSNAKLSIVV